MLASLLVLVLASGACVYTYLVSPAIFAPVYARADWYGICIAGLTGIKYALGKYLKIVVDNHNGIRYGAISR